MLLVIATQLPGQNKELDRLISSELQMTFPGIYFKHNSEAYTEMPYTVDSCFRYIAQHIKDINEFVIWRDSTETETLTNKRIKKLKAALNVYAPSAKIKIQSMRGKQKISQHTLNMSGSDYQKQYLLSLNSVFDIAKAKVRTESKLTNHMLHPKINCSDCWKNGFHLQTRRKLKKMQKQNRQAQVQNILLYGSAALILFLIS